ncbi:MAG: hypothetical protein ABEN55_06685 [Bradymonadaceae bacterium]
MTNYRVQTHPHYACSWKTRFESQTEPASILETDDGEVRVQKQIEDGWRSIDISETEPIEFEGPWPDGDPGPGVCGECGSWTTIDERGLCETCVTDDGGDDGG